MHWWEASHMEWWRAIESLPDPLFTTYSNLSFHTRFNTKLSVPFYYDREEAIGPRQEVVPSEPVSPFHEVTVSSEKMLWKILFLHQNRSRQVLQCFRSEVPATVYYDTLFYYCPSITACVTRDDPNTLLVNITTPKFSARTCQVGRISFLLPGIMP